MNIFVTNADPRVSAQALDDKRVIKMILETAQMLSTAMHVLGIPGAPYKPTHINHPCSIWVRTNWNNFRWTTVHLDELCTEYWRRYGKIHKCAQYLNLFAQANDSLLIADLTPFANCTPHKDMSTIEAYKRTLNEKWALDKRAPTWKNGCKPNW